MAAAAATTRALITGPDLLRQCCCMRLAGCDRAMASRRLVAATGTVDRLVKPIFEEDAAVNALNLWSRVNVVAGVVWVTITPHRPYWGNREAAAASAVRA